MTGFGSLVFTDCREGEGLLGAAGFQFRAVSAGVDARAMELVQRTCLYEPPPHWMREQRPVADYPRSLAHVRAEGTFATASGRYLGTEVKGHREGNHVTSAVVTDDVTRFGQVRPAQLWRAPVWVDRVDGDRICDPVPAEPEPGPLVPQQLQRWIADQRGAEDMLVAVVSALEEVGRGGQRVVFVADDPEPVLAWLASATLLMPRPDALAVGFKVFAVNVQYCPHDVVGLHVDWAGAFRGAPDGLGFTVFDLVAGVHSPVTPTVAARFWAPRFLGGDCFDVLDAVELSGVLRNPAGPRRPELVLAAAFGLGERIAPSELDSVLEWLGSGDGTGLSGRRRGQLFDLILAARPDADQLRILAVAADRFHEPGLSERIRWQVFAREVAALVPQAVDEAAVGPVDPRSATLLLETVLHGADPPSLVHLLDLAVAYGLSPNLTWFRDALRGFARWWADGALDVPGVDRWSCHAEVIDLLRDELAGRIRGAPPSSVRTIGELWWRRLHPTVQDPRSELDVVLTAAAMHSGDATVRAKVTRVVLDAAAGFESAEAIDVAWRALFTYRSPGVEDLLSLLRAVAPGAGVPAAALGRITDVLAAHPTARPEVLAVLARLAELGLDPGQEPLTSWQRQLEVVQAVTCGLAECSPDRAEADPGWVAARARELGGISVDVLRAEVGRPLDALCRLHPAVGSTIVLDVPAAQRAVLTGELERIVPHRRDAGSAALAFMVMAVATDKTAATRLRSALAAAGQAMDLGPRNKVAGYLDNPRRELWWELCEVPSVLGWCLRCLKRLAGFGRRRSGR